MEEARKKLRVCLFFVVLLAVLIGCIYYFNDVKKQERVSEGTLVMNDISVESSGAGAGNGRETDGLY